MFRSSYSLQFIFVLLFPLFESSKSILKSKNDESFENYVIDVFFSNALTIIRCNQYERYVLKTVTMQSIGELRCENSDQFLPSNHLEQIALFEWKGTQSKCIKKSKTIIEETTVLQIIHKGKSALKKYALKIIRLGSTDSTEGKEQNNQLFFKHGARSLVKNTNDNYTTNIYSFKHRPVLCQEKYLNPTDPCNPQESRHNLSYFCYYRIGVKEPPTIADMDHEMIHLSKEVNLDQISLSGHYSNRKPKPKKKSTNIWWIGGIALAITAIIAGGSIWCCSSDSESNDQGKKQADSDTSIATKDS